MPPWPPRSAMLVLSCSPGTRSEVGVGQVLVGKLGGFGLWSFEGGGGRGGRHVMPKWPIMSEAFSAQEIEPPKRYVGLQISTRKTL